jgi:HEPN domain-containing protein
MNKEDFEKLVDIRLKEAKILLDAKAYQGAYYLGGYALEAGLKASICKQVKACDFPDKKLATACHTHNLRDLIGVAGLKPA